MSKTEESKIQIEVFDWIRGNTASYPALKLIHHYPSSFFGVNYGVVVWLKKLGWIKGVPGIFIPIARGGFSGLYIEMKTAKGKLSPEQKEFFEMINFYSDIPYKTETCRRSDEAIRSIKNYLEITEDG